MRNLLRCRRVSGSRPGSLLSSVFVVLALAVVPSSAQPPSGYYVTVDSTDSTALRLTLHEAIDDHIRYPYTASSTDTWDIINMADEDPNAAGNILDIYMNASYTKIPGGVGAYNREHSWPKSYGFPNDGTGNYPYTDTHHLFASDAGYNSSRSNKPFRYCTAGCSENTTLFNDGRGGGSGVYPGNSNWTTGSFSTGSWETWSGRRGDVARALFYMDVRYEGGIHGVTGILEPNLELTDDDTLIDASSTGVNESLAFMGILSDLLQWHEEDPVDGLETWRNDVVFSFQGNRNPFIDHPEWVQCIYNNVCSFDSVPPAIPQGLMVTVHNGALTLDWMANGEADLAGYNLFRSTTPGGPYGLINGPLITGTSYVDGGLLNGTTYYYAVAAVDTSNNESGLSAEASGTPDGGLPDTTPPIPPEGLAGSGGDGQAQLTWTANGEGDLDGYHVYRSTLSGSGFVRANGSLLTINAFTDGGLTNGTTYFYVVTAVDTSGNESFDSAEIFVTPAAAGGGTLVLSEVFYDPASTDDGLEWVELYNPGPGSVDLSGYSLGNGGTDYTYSLVQLAGSIGPGQTFVVGGPTSGAANGNPIYNQVLNFTPDFQNSGSTADGVALFDLPAAQVNAATVPVDAVIYGGSNANSLIDETGAAKAPEVGDAASGSSLERLDLAGAWQIQGTPNPGAVPFGGTNTAPVVTITAPSNGATFDDGDAIVFTGTATDPEDGPLSASITWSSNLDGALGSGASITVSLSLGSHTISASVTDSGGLPGSSVLSVSVVDAPPAAPTGLGASAGNTEVQLSWNANGEADLSGYNLYRSTTSGGGYGLVNGTLISATSFTDTGLVNGTTYFYVLTAVDSGANESADSTEASATPVATATGTILLSEVFYDPAGTDDGLEWVELYNAGATTVDLSAYSLGNGGTTYTASLVQLAGTVAPGQTFVVGGPTSNASNGTPSYDQALNFTPDFQNSGTTADGVALFAVPAAQVTGATVPVDAVVYGGSNASGLIDETGAANSPEVGDAPSGSSLERLDQAGTWQIQGAPTPNTTPLAGGGPPVTVTFTSVGAHDGWVRESSETSGVGGAINSTGTGTRPLRSGDASGDRQYKILVSFDTSSIPAGATVTGATLRLRRGTVRGTNPFSILGSCLVDVNSGGFGGNVALAASDFQAAATAPAAATMSEPTANGDFSEGGLDAAGLGAVNTAGFTQLRVYFQTDDNDDGGDDYMGYRSGNDSNAANHPELVVTYLP